MLHRIFCICFKCLEQFRWFWKRRELSGDWGVGWYFTYTGLASLGAGLHFHPFLPYIINIFFIFKQNSLDLFVHQRNDLYCPRTPGFVSGVLQLYCQYTSHCLVFRKLVWAAISHWSGRWCICSSHWSRNNLLIVIIMQTPHLASYIVSSILEAGRVDHRLNVMLP